MLEIASTRSRFVRRLYIALSKPDQVEAKVGRFVDQDKERANLPVAVETSELVVAARARLTRPSTHQL